MLVGRRSHRKRTESRGSLGARGCQRETTGFLIPPLRGPSSLIPQKSRHISENLGAFPSVSSVLLLCGLCSAGPTGVPSHHVPAPER